MTETVARPHVANFIAWAADKPDVVVLSADLTNSCEVGPWRDYAFGEKAYLVLSLAAKSALAWQIFAGSLAT